MSSLLKKAAISGVIGAIICLVLTVLLSMLCIVAVAVGSRFVDFNKDVSWLSVILISYAIVSFAATIIVVGLSGVIAGLLAAWWAREDIKRLIDAAGAGLIAGITDCITFMLLYCIMFIIIEMISILISIWQNHSSISLIFMDIMLGFMGIIMSFTLYIPLLFIGCIGTLILSLISSTVYAIVILKKDL